ncbi:MAG: AraC family transcriptional regulator [Bacteroidetes bacterium]|nr:AraC family transcriptional regulator [Bacteroidota bacterium]
MKLYIKNMVCTRCKKIVKAELEKIGILYDSIEIGEVMTKGILSSEQRIRLVNSLQRFGFELLEEWENDLLEKLKNAILDLEQYSNEELKTSYSDYISLKVNDNFSSLNSLFCEIEGITIEKYIIKHKIELVKNLLVSDYHSLNEIASKMHYSNLSRLKNQFENNTGLTPLRFRQLRQAKGRNPENN